MQGRNRIYCAAKQRVTGRADEEGEGTEAEDDGA
jgi:hypothetical protein